MVQPESAPSALLPRERVRRALRGEPVDRPPVAYLFLGGARHVLGRLGSRMSVVYRDPEAIADAQMIAAEMFGHDSAMVPWGCLTVEAEAFGCRLEWFDDFYPRVAARPLEGSKDLSLLADPDPSRSGRMPLVLESLTRLRERAGDDLFIVAMVVSPFLVAAELRGMVELLEDFVTDPRYVEALFEHVTEGTGRYVRAIAETGAADAIMFENAGACREMMGPHHMERFLVPAERRLLRTARDAAPGLFLIEHNCSATPYFEDVLRLDVDAVSCGHGDERLLQQAADDGRPVASIGRVDNTRTMLEARPDQVEREASACIRSAHGSRFVLSTNCEIPFTAPLENIEALARAARRTRCSRTGAIQ